MKATGIVRRIDDLGRVVIPKEIRRIQKLRQGDSLEIFVNTEGEVIFKKYSPVGELSALAQPYAQVLAKNLGAVSVICDRDHVVAAAGPGRRQLEGAAITPALEKLLDARAPYAWAAGSRAVQPVREAAEHLLAASPILAQGDVAGGVLLLAARPGPPPTAEQCKAVQIAAGFIAKQLEE